MPGAIKMSEATSMALHTMTYLAAKRDTLVPANRIAGDLKISGNHLAKVLQRLVKAELVDSTRGPKGGFKLSREPERITLNEVYEVMEGPVSEVDCLYGAKMCDSEECIFHGLLGSVSRMLSDYLNKTTLSDVAEVYKRG